MSIGRPLEYDPSIALEQARNLFWRRGYANASLPDLLKAMGLSRSSFYQAFKSKHNLFEKSLELYQIEHARGMRERLKASPSARDFVKSMFYGVAEKSESSRDRIGCLVMNSASEFAQRDPVVARIIKRSIEAFVDVFEEAVIRGQQSGEISKNHDPRTLGRFLVANMSGLNTMLKAGASAHEIRSIADVTLLSLD